MPDTSAIKRKVTWAEVHKHATPDDAWIVINGKAYDVTKYAQAHPGGPEWILDWLGKDASQAFAMKGGMGVDHSDFAKEELGKLYIGDVT